MTTQKRKTRRKPIRKVRDAENARQLRMFDNTQLAFPLSNADSRKSPTKKG